MIALSVGALVATPAAHAAVPTSLKSSCTVKTPHPGYSFKFCDDGLPPSGGTASNQPGTNAVKVPMPRKQPFGAIGLRAMVLQ